MVIYASRLQSVIPFIFMLSTFSSVLSSHRLSFRIFCLCKVIIYTDLHVNETYQAHSVCPGQCLNSNDKYFSETNYTKCHYTKNESFFLFNISYLPNTCWWMWWCMDAWADQFYVKTSTIDKALILNVCLHNVFRRK